MVLELLKEHAEDTIHADFEQKLLGESSEIYSEAVRRFSELSEWLAKNNL